MCGIAGYVDFEGKTNPSVIDKMLGEIIHRGPDSGGSFVSRNKRAVLGIRRLSIIDLTTGDQPIKNEDGSVAVTYNGEIYNYKNLKEYLLKKGHKFRTKTDTEVIVHLYEDKGIELTKLLNGMFAFALWDEGGQKLVLARDRVGIKPLYYFRRGSLLIYASEVKAILSHPSYKKEVDEEGLNLYGYYGFLPGTKSIFRGITKLLPGHTLIFTKSGVSIKKYFDITVEETANEESLDSLLEKSVTMQLQADVPVGIFLSGGLDSSLIAYYVTKTARLKSFSIGFKEPGFDESGYAHQVAKKIGTEHYSEEFTPSDVPELFEKISKKLDEPLADASLLPTYKVSQLARKYVKVSLSGDGGDELFAGYPTQQAHLLANYLDLFPNSGRILESILDRIPDSFLNLIPLSFKDYPKKKLGKIVLRGLSKKNPARHMWWMRTFFLGEGLLFGKADTNLINKVIPSLSNVKDPIKKAQIIDFYTYLRDVFLVKTDRASMFNSLEVRVPYLDNDVINYAFASKTPHATFTRTKIHLRKIIEEKLPEIARRPKKGFGIPLEKWLRGSLKDFSYSTLDNPKLYNYVEKKKIERLLTEHNQGRSNNSGAIWQLIVLSGWLTNWA